MFKYKAIVSDFDGTLVGPNFKISKEIEIAIKSYVKSGGFFTIATGRGYQGPVKNACKILSLKRFRNG